jgi:hypothetical protein
MIPMAAMRRLGPSLLGLFLVAQAFGVVPLMTGHTAHLAETHSVFSKDNASNGNIPQGHHHRGDADGFIQHHELQDLNGALTCLVSCCGVAFVHRAITAYTPNALAEADTILLERPPKPLLSI